MDILERRSKATFTDHYRCFFEIIQLFNKEVFESHLVFCNIPFANFTRYHFNHDRVIVFGIYNRFQCGGLVNKKIGIYIIIISTIDINNRIKYPMTIMMFFNVCENFWESFSFHKSLLFSSISITLWKIYYF